MPSAFALIRGINVGGKHKLPMASLRSLCEGLGWLDVATLIQSGNVVFRLPGRESQRALTAASDALASAIEDSCGFRAGVLVRSVEHLRTALAASPFAERPGVNKSHVLIMFLDAEPDAAARKAVASLRPDPERVEVIGREVHLHYPKSIGESKFPFTRVEQALGQTGTCRNVNTLTKLLAMAEALGG